MNRLKARARLRAAISLGLVLCLVPICWAEELPTAAPADVGLSAEKLNGVKAAMQAMIDQRQIAGAIVMVARRGKVAYFETAGLCDVETGKPMERDSICRFYSMTKPITSVAAMMLVEQGKIGLDDPVSKHLPELKSLQVFVKSTDSGVETATPKREPTVRDLLRHTSGLTYGVFGSTTVDEMYKKAGVLDPSRPLAALTKKLRAIPLLCEPGTKWNYSVSTDVLGRVVEVASGSPLDVFFEERIFRPLDMRDSGFYVPEERVGRLASVHGPKEEGGLRVVDAAGTSAFRSKPALLSGGGGLVSTARDYMRFCQMLSGGGQLNGTRLLSPATVEMMTSNQLPNEAMPISFGPVQRLGVGFGLGFSVRVAASPLEPGVVGEYGWGGAASTHFWISPKDELVVVALQQFMPFTPRLEMGLKPVIYGAITR